MKTFNDSDLITWANRDKAIIGNEYYFCDSLEDLRVSIKNKIPCALININKDNCAYTFKNEHLTYYACILPADKIIDEPEKKYRACRNVKELYELIFNTKSKADTKFYINELVGTVIHFKQKGFDTTVYECITGIAVYINGDIDVRINGCNFELPELFKKYEIEINGEWVPFGVEE